MVFNGLKGAELIIYNALHQFDLSRPVSIGQIASMTYYDPSTIKRALGKLEAYKVIERERQGRGRPYKYSIKG